MKSYTIIAGVNGVGKTSFTGVLKAERNDLGCIIDVDKMAADRKLNFFDAGKLAIRKIDNCLAKDVSFLQETTLSGRRIEKVIKLAKEKDYVIRLFYIGLNTKDESKKRIRNRVEKGGHDISEKDVDRRFSNRFESLITILPYCDEVRLFDNENGFVEVGEYRNGEVIVKGDYRPQWLTDLRTTIQNDSRE